jgi:hypothetical protein
MRIELRSFLALFENAVVSVNQAHGESIGNCTNFIDLLFRSWLGTSELLLNLSSESDYLLIRATFYLNMHV